MTPASDFGDVPYSPRRTKFDRFYRCREAYRLLRSDNKSLVRRFSARGSKLPVGGRPRLHMRRAGN